MYYLMPAELTSLVYKGYARECSDIQDQKTSPFLQILHSFIYMFVMHNREERIAATR